MTMSKIGLVLEGGGMKCAYTAGILDAMMDNSVTFDYCIGVSAGSANGVSFIAGQRGRNIRFYTEHINEKGYFGLSSFLKTGNLFGLQYIYGTLTNSGGADPLDFDAFMKSPMEYWLVATDAQTGKPTYFSKKDMYKDDYRHVMASCAIPAVCRPVEIDGRFYYDGGVSDSIPVQKAMDDGCDKLVVILTKPHDFVKEPERDRFIYKRLCRKYPKIIEALDHRHIMYKACQDKMFALEKSGKAFVFAPEHVLGGGTYSMDAKEEEAIYEMGIRDFYARQEKLKAFMK